MVLPPRGGSLPPTARARQGILELLQREGPPWFNQSVPWPVPPEFKVRSQLSGVNIYRISARAAKAGRPAVPLQMQWVVWSDRQPTVARQHRVQWVNRKYVGSRVIPWSNPE